MVESNPSRSGRQSHSAGNAARSSSYYAFYEREPRINRRLVTEQQFDAGADETSHASAVEDSRGRLARRRRIVASAAVVCAYVALGLAAFWPDLPHISEDIFSRASLGDPQLSAWELAWVQHALVHGLNPFFSHAVVVPTGLNLGVNTAAPLLGLLTLPLTPFLGPVAILNLIAVAAMPVSAMAAFLVLRKWKVWLPAAALGGLVYGFGPNMVGQNLDLHIELTFLPLPPLIAATVVSILQRRGSRWRLGLQLGLLMAAQYLISPEVAAMVVVIAVAAIVLVAIRRPALVRELTMPVAPSFVIGGFVTLALIAYPLWMLVAGPQHVPGPPHPLNNPYNKNDLLNFVVPGPSQRVSFGMRSLGTGVVDRLIVGENSYIGIPVLMVLGYLVYRARRVPRVQLTSALLLLSAILTLGPHLVVDGHYTYVPLPFLLIDHVPSVNSIIPTRFGFAVDACLAALLAFSLDEVVRQHRTAVRHGPRRTLRMPALRPGALAVTALVVVGVTLLPVWPYGATRASALPAQIRQAIPAGNPVAVTYPYATYFHADPMVWQADDRFKFRLLGGDGFQPWPKSADPSGWLGLDRPVYPPPMNPVGLQQFLASHEGVGLYGPSPVLNSNLIDITRSTLSKYGVKIVIVDSHTPGSGPVTNLFRMALGPPTATAGWFALWNVGSKKGA
jgi:hypothetical protein